MAVPIPDSHKRLLDEPVMANLDTIMPDGRPQVNPVTIEPERVVTSG